MLKIRRIMPLVLITALLGVAPALANNGDLFDTGDSATSPRPWVPSDLHRSSDLFPRQSPYVRTDKDMFDSVQQPGSIDVEDLFAAHLHDIPDDPLYNWPKHRSYP